MEAVGFWRLAEAVESSRVRGSSCAGGIEMYSTGPGWCSELMGFWCSKKPLVGWKMSWICTGCLSSSCAAVVAVDSLQNSSSLNTWLALLMSYLLAYWKDYYRTGWCIHC